VATGAFYLFLLPDVVKHGDLAAFTFLPAPRLRLPHDVVKLLIGQLKVVGHEKVLLLVAKAPVNVKQAAIVVQSEIKKYFFKMASDSRLQGMKECTPLSQCCQALNKISFIRRHLITVNSAYNKLFGTMTNSSLDPDFLINV